MTNDDLNGWLETASKVFGLAVTVWLVWDLIGEWRRATIVAELRKLAPAIDTPEVEPSGADIAAVIRRAEQLTRNDDNDGMEFTEQGG